MSTLKTVTQAMAIVFALTLSHNTNAVPMTFNAIDAGSYSQSGGHSPSSTAYAAGYSSFLSSEFRNFFVFDFGAGITPTRVNSATLRLNHGASQPTGTLALSAVSTPLSDLLGGVNSTTIFDDLGTGTSLGNHVFTSSLLPITSTDIVLNTNAVSALDNMFNNGGLWALGGAFLSQVGGLRFVGTSLADARLIIDVDDAPIPAPEPGALALMLSGLLALAYQRRTRRGNQR